MRRVGGFSKDDEDSATGPQLVSIGNAKKLITKIEQFYTEKSVNFEKEWAENEVREAWTNAALNAETCEELATLLTKLDDGMTAPKIINSNLKGDYLKLANHKFWPS